MTLSRVLGWFHGGLLACILLLPVLRGGAALTLHPAAKGPHDLRVEGELLGVPAGEARWLRWSDVRALPTRELSLRGEFLPGEQKVTVVLLESLLDALPLGPEADAVLADCTDGYLSIFDRAFIARWKPVVVLEIDGRGPEAWPPPGLTFNPGPYVITVAEELTPGVKGVLDIDHKRPWGVNTLRLVNAARALADFHAGAWAELSERAARGREVWVNSCLSCHVGPGETVGGRKAGRPFAVVEAYGRHMPDYFANYVRDPKKVNESAQMTAHPHYTDAEMAEIIAFVTAEKP